VGNEQVANLVDMWTVVWTVLLLAGYLAELTPFPRLAALRTTTAASVMLLTSSLVVFVLILADHSEAAAVLVAWAIVTCSVKLIWEMFERE
jgi:hypothetical protein